MTNITTFSDRTILDRCVGDLPIVIRSTDDPHEIEAEATIDGRLCILGIRSHEAIPLAGPLREACIEQLGLGLADKLRRPR